MDETDIASVEFSTLPLRRTLKNSSKERHAESSGINYGQDEDERERRRKREKERVRSERLRLKKDDTRE